MNFPFDRNTYELILVRAAKKATPAGTTWLTTAPRNTKARGYDCGQRGWRVHAVKADTNERFGDVRARPAACGLLPAHGWGADLYIERPCLRCLKAIMAASEVNP